MTAALWAAVAAYVGYAGRQGVITGPCKCCEKGCTRTTRLSMSCE